jgi:hypothetical protein
MEIERAARADGGDGEPLVATVDAMEGLPTQRARDLARRLWYLGWCGLPLAWAYNAYMFWPHIAPDPSDASDVGLTVDADDGADAYPSEQTRRDPVVARYAEMSMRGAKAVGVVVVAWAATFLLGGEWLVGETLWNRLSITALPPLT